MDNRYNPLVLFQHQINPFCRYLAASDYFAAAGYRSLGTYYPEYAAHAALGNTYLDVAGQRDGRARRS